MVSCLLESRVGAVVDKTVTNRSFDVAPFIFDNISTRIRSPRISHIRFGHSICDTQDLIEIRTTPIRDRQCEVRVPLRGLRKLGCANFGRGAPKRGERRAVSSEDFVSSDRGVLGASLFDYDVNLIVDYVTNI